MESPPRHPIELPERLSDESAALILDFLYEVIQAFESRYFVPIRRHHRDTAAEYAARRADRTQLELPLTIPDGASDPIF